jgi:hypothetical protein
VTGDYRTTRNGITVEIQHDWIARPPERDIAPTGLGVCEFCEFDVLAGSEIASVNDGRYAHYDCVPWGDEEEELLKRKNAEAVRDMKRDARVQDYEHGGPS